MSKAKGRKYERELIELLESYGCHVKDCHANAGISGRFDCDLMVWPQGVTPAPGWELGEDPAMVELEVKYSAKGRGFSKLYDAHLRGYGLGGVESHGWTDGIKTGGVVAMLSDAGDCWQEDGACLTSFLVSAFKTGVTVVACRMARKPWIFAWRSGQ